LKIDSSVIMAKLTFTNYLSAFTSINGVLASTSILIPGLAFFTAYAPPFAEITLLTAGISTATIFISYYYGPSTKAKKGSGLPPLIRIATKALIFSVVLIVGYVVLLELCSILIQGTKKTIQIGFGTLDWSLTEYGQRVKAEDPVLGPADWLQQEGLTSGVAKRIWTPWSVYSAGSLMIVVFMLAFISWAFGWSLIAKQRAIDGIGSEVPPPAKV
jgi:hypothetical protein